MRIALCGPRGPEKEELFDHLRTLRKFYIVDDPKRYLSKLDASSMISFEEGGQDWLNLWTAITRRIEVIRASQVIGMEAVTEADILTDTWALDDLMLQSTWLSYQMEMIQNTPQLVDPSGNLLMAQKQALANRSGAIVQTLLNQAEEEIMDVYDYVYMKLPFKMDPLVEQYVDFTKSVPAFQRVIEIPQLMNEAKDFLTKESKKWDEAPVEPEFLEQPTNALEPEVVVLENGRHEETINS